jgi:hypothetical protein
MPNSPPNTLINSPHARILVEIPPSRCRTGLLLRLVSRVLLVRLFFNVLDLGLPDRAAYIGKWQPDYEDPTSQAVGEVDSFGEFAADYGEQEGALAC